MSASECTELPTKRDIEIFQNRLFENVMPVHPTAIVTVGGPGSGKSSAQKDCVKKLKMKLNDFVVLDRDEIYTKLFNQNNNCYYVPADKMGIEYVNNLNINLAINGNYNVIIDGTGKDYDKTMRESIQYFKRNGYRVVICMTLLEYEKALPRIEKRRKKTGRSVTSDYLLKTYKAMEIVIPQYLNLSSKIVDAIFIYNNEDRLGLMFERFGNEYYCYQPEAIMHWFPKQYTKLCSRH